MDVAFNSNADRRDCLDQEDNMGDTEKKCGTCKYYEGWGGNGFCDRQGYEVREDGHCVQWILKKSCRTCEYWDGMYQQCESPDQIASEAGEYDSPPDKVCGLWEPGI